MGQKVTRNWPIQDLLVHAYAQSGHRHKRAGRGGVVSYVDSVHSCHVTDFAVSSPVTHVTRPVGLLVEATYAARTLSPSYICNFLLARPAAERACAHFALLLRAVFLRAVRAAVRNFTSIDDLCDTFIAYGTAQALSPMK
eukprot:scaffold357707_cov63-Attheya_sp.AAC.1